MILQMCTFRGGDGKVSIRKNRFFIYFFFFFSEIFSKVEVKKVNKSGFLYASFVTSYNLYSAFVIAYHWGV